MRDVTVLFRELARNEGHVRVQVFMGRNPGARGNAGELVLRTDEWDEWKARARWCMPKSIDFDVRSQEIA